MQLKAILLALVLSIFATTSGADAMEQETLRKFLDPIQYAAVDISPSGKYISLIQREDEKNTLIIMDLATMTPTTSVKYGEKGKTSKLNICCIKWITDDLLAYGTSRKMGTLEGEGRQGNIYLLKADGSRNDRVWTPMGNYENNSAMRGKLYKGWASIESVLEGDNDRILLFNQYWDSNRPNLITMKLSNGDMSNFRRLPENTQQVWGASALETIESKSDVDLLVSTSTREDRFMNKYSFFVSDNGGDWTPLVFALEGFSDTWTPHEINDRFIFGEALKDGSPNSSTHVVRYDREKKIWDDMLDIGFATLYEINTNDDGELSRVHFVDDDSRTMIFDKKSQTNKILSYLMKSYEGFQIGVEGSSKDGNKTILSIGSSSVLPEFFLYDSEKKAVSFLIGSTEALVDFELSEAEYFSYVNSEGIEIPGWFQPAKKGVRSPLVVYIHGGPHGPFEQYGFSPRYHILNQLGYSVYAPNFRGSGGFGLNFQEAGYKRWGTGMIDDMQEGAQALADAGLVDSSMICAFGGSYGGYGTAQSLVRHPNFYDCGIIVAGVFDLEEQIKRSDTGGFYSGRAYMANVIGTDPAELRNQSPIKNLDKVKAPMLILHGTKDKRTPFKGAEQMVAALKGTDIDFEYKYYDKEGHGNRKMENRIDEWQRISTFLQRVRASTAKPASGAASAGE
ncbi:MAG: alpha/beta hydrolase family protein [Candidatus Azotimanducaceae bacterium]